MKIPALSIIVISILVGIIVDRTCTAEESQAATSISVTDTSSNSALEELVQVLNEESELATRTRLNVDFVPGVMTVLHGSDLEARGVQTVYDALGLVPGIELSRTNDGRPKVLIRGIGLSFFSGKVKFLLNNTPFNGTLGATSNLLVLPIEQVERLEVIRGPGSAIYGEYASVGVVNVITRHDKLNGFVRLTDLKRKTYGGSASYEFDQSKLNYPLKLDFSFSATDVAGGDIEVNNDIMRGTPITNAPGPINNKEQHRSYLFNMYYRDYHFSWQSVEEGLGDFYGINNALPSEGQRVVSIFRSQNFELSRSVALDQNWSSKTKLGYFNFVVDSSPHELYPPGFNAGTGVFPDGVLGSPYYEDGKWYLISDFMYNGLKDHEILLGVDLSYLKEGDTYIVRNYDPLTFTPNGAPPVMEKFTGSENWIKDGLERRVLAMYAQDQFTFTEKLKLTAGLRFDYYDDVGSDLTPRLAAVYQLSDQKTFKFQYAKSFRPPTFLELYTQNNPIVNGNEHLDSEHLTSIELGYVHNDGVTIFRSTLFKYTLNDLIQVEYATGTYENQGRVVANGMEVEYLQQVDRQTKVDTNFSYINSEDAETGNRIPGVANVLGNFAVLYEPWPDYVFSWQFKHVTYRPREPSDTRPDLNDYSTSDITANFLNFGAKRLTFRFGVRNLFDSKIKYPSFLVGTPPLPAYLNDYPQSGRELFVQANYSFL